MRTPIKEIKTGNEIKILPRTRLKNGETNLVVTTKDAICMEILEVVRVNMKSIQVRFLGDTYRLEFKSNPSVELIETSKIAKNEHKNQRQPISIRTRNLV